jgi:hypothetical protein
MAVNEYTSLPSRVAVSGSVISPNGVAADAIVEKSDCPNNADGVDRGVNSIIFVCVGSGLSSGTVSCVRRTVVGVAFNSFVSILRIDTAGVGVGVGVVRVRDAVGFGVEMTFILFWAYVSAGNM